MVLGAAALAVLILIALVLWVRQARKPLGPAPELEFPTQTLSLEGWDYHYVEVGRGPTLLLLHGIGANLLCWRGLWPLLSDHFQVIALDLPGFGRSSKHGSGFGLDEQAERLEKFVAAKGIKTYHLVGNSMGANLALWLTARSPRSVLSLTVIAPATSPRLVPLPLHGLAWLARPLALLISRATIRWAHRRTVNNKSLVDQTRVTETWHTYGRNQEAIESFLRATWAIRDPRLRQALKTLPTEVLILWGENDSLVPRSVIDDLRATLPKAHVKIHPSGGHHLQEDEPSWVKNELDLFLGPKNKPERDSTGLS